MATEFKLPELGENIQAADVVNVLVKEGDTISQDQAVLELETEKAVLELPCPHAGRIEKIHVKVGDHIPVGTTVLTIEAGEQAAAPAEQPRTKEKAEPERQPEGAVSQQEEQRQAEKKRDVEEGAGITPPPEPTRAAPPKEERRPTEALTQAPRAESAQQVAPETRGIAERPREDRPPAPASPAIRRLAREMGIDLNQVKGTGPAGRITEDDVHTHVRGLAAGPKEAPAAPAAGVPSLPDFAQWGPVDRQPVGNIRRKTAESMTNAWRMVPQVTQYDLCDITDLEAQRKRYMQAKGEKAPKVTVTAILLRAVVAVLKEYPKFNSSFDMQAGELIYKKYFHIGVAVDTEHGLLVPVIRDVDRKSVVQLAKELDEIAQRARDRKLSLEEMRGSSFTITNLGGIGGTAFSPIVYWPEVAILGVARARKEQVIIGDAPQIRLMMPLCLSYDHRVIDGADGARFCRRLGQVLSDPLALFMES